MTSSLSLGTALILICVQAASAAPQNPPESALVQSFAQLVVGPPPDSLGLDPFYKKHADAYGVPIVASETARQPSRSAWPVFVPMPSPRRFRLHRSCCGQTRAGA
jgi:hypothetical protein